MNRGFFLVLALLVAVAGGVAAGSLVPSLSQAVRSTAASLRIPGLAPSPAAESARPQKDPQPTEAKSAEKGGEEADLLKLTPERIAMARIEVAAAKGSALQRHITVPGTIIPASDRMARIPAKVVGTVAELHKRLGDLVVKGEVVAVLDSREVADTRGEYLTASVNLDLQRTAFERAQSLWDKRIMAESQYLQARASFSEAQLRLDLGRQKLLALQLDPKEVVEAAKQNPAAPGASLLRQYRIRSPASGRVVERKVDVGASMGQQNDPTELYALVDLSVVWIDLAVSMTDLVSVKQGQKVLVLSGGNGPGGRRGESRIVFVSPLLDKETRSARVVAEIDNPDETWRPGLFVTAEIAIEDPTAKVVVPRSAIQTIGGEPVVFVRTPDGFQKRVVTLGRGDDRVTELTAGVQLGEIVAVGNSFALKAELGRAQLED